MGSWLQRLLDRARLQPHVGSPSPVPPVGSAALQAAPDRRAHARVPLQLSVRLRFDSAEDLIASRTFDISLSGAFIALRNPRPRETPVRLILEVAERQLTIEGVVARSSDGKGGGRCGMGIRFTEMTPDDSAALSDLLKQTS